MRFRPQSARAYFIFACILASGCHQQAVVENDHVVVRLTAQATSWKASYLVGNPEHPTQVQTGREVHVPLKADVQLLLASRDFVSDFTLPDLGLRDFAAPGISSEIHFRADHPGRYLVRGDELCGRPYTEKSVGWLVVEAESAFQDWVHSRAREDVQ